MCRILSLVGSVWVWYTSFCVWAVVPSMSAKLPGIFPRAYVSTLSFSDRTWHIFKYLRTKFWRTLCPNNCFNILDHASATFQLTIKEAIHILKGKNLHIIICNFSHSYVSFCPYRSLISILVDTIYSTLYFVILNWRWHNFTSVETCF